MATKKISGYTEKTTLASDDLFLLEQATGTYRKFSSSRLTQVITSNTTLTIGTGGTYANFVEAMAYLKNKWIPFDITVTLRLCSNLVLNSSAQFTFPSTHCACEINHPCSSQIQVDLAGYNITVGDGSITCQGFYVPSGNKLYIYSSAPGSVIRSAKNLSGSGIFAYNASVFNLSSSANRIQIGYNGYGFEVGVDARQKSIIDAKQMALYYNAYGCYARVASIIMAEFLITEANTTRGFHALTRGYIYRNGCTGAQATDCSPAVGTEGNYGARID